MCGISVVQFSYGRALCRDGVLYMHACMGVLCMVEGTLLFLVLCGAFRSINCIVYGFVVYFFLCLLCS